MIDIRYTNPPPSFNWEPLDLEAVFKLTNIKLNHKGWKTYFTNFHEFQTRNHTPECKAKALYGGYSGCNCSLGDALIAIWKAASQEVNIAGRGTELFINVPYEKIEDRSILLDPVKRPLHVLELLSRGFEQLITLLKVYEVTRLVLDFGPPMVLRKGERFKDNVVREIDGDILWEILYKEKEECQKEKSLLSQEQKLLYSQSEKQEKLIQ